MISSSIFFHEKLCGEGVDQSLILKFINKSKKKMK